MRESRTYGSVRGGYRKVSVYSIKSYMQKKLRTGRSFFVDNYIAAAIYCMRRREEYDSLSWF